MRYSIDRGQVTMTFDAKPPENVRQALKANGFRWSPQAGFWWRRCVTGAADVIGAIEKMITPKQPDGSCRICKASDGHFRPVGACGATVLCDDCEDRYTFDVGDSFDLHSCQVNGCYLHDGVWSPHSARPGRYRVLEKNGNEVILGIATKRGPIDRFRCGVHSLRAVIGEPWSNYTKGGTA